MTAQRLGADGTDAGPVASEDVLPIPQGGVRLEIRRRAADTGGAYVEFDVVGRPRGLLARPHVHELHEERIEVIDGAMRLVLDGGKRVLRTGEDVTIPAGAPHAQQAVPGEPFHVRVRWTPPAGAEAFGERLAAMAREGGLTRFGYPRPLAAARLGLEFGRYSHPAWPPLRVQLVIAATLVRAAAGIGRLVARGRAAGSRS
jgi:quercetin dioxygenase-like cupin family protein